jgi:hypothetical protein
MGTDPVQARRTFVQRLQENTPFPLQNTLPDEEAIFSGDPVAFQAFFSAAARYLESSAQTPAEGIDQAAVLSLEIFSSPAEEESASSVLAETPFEAIRHAIQGLIDEMASHGFDCEVVVTRTNNPDLLVHPMAKELREGTPSVVSLDQTYLMTLFVNNIAIAAIQKTTGPIELLEDNQEFQFRGLLVSSAFVWHSTEQHGLRESGAHSFRYFVAQQLFDRSFLDNADATEVLTRLRTHRQDMQELLEATEGRLHGDMEAYVSPAIGESLVSIKARGHGEYPVLYLRVEWGEDRIDVLQDQFVESGEESDMKRVQITSRAFDRGQEQLAAVLGCMEPHEWRSFFRDQPIFEPETKPQLSLV